MVGDFVEFVANSELLKDIFSFIGKIAGGLYDVIGYLVDGLKWVWNNVVMPILNGIEKAYRWIKGTEMKGGTNKAITDSPTGKKTEEQRETGKSFRIAVAHHREDQAETVLFHLCRGTDLRGARGMQPVNGQIIRPLLCESRASIENYLTERGFSWQEDETNSDTSYTRNYLRREIIPRLESGVHTGAAKRISQFAAVCREAEEYLTRVTERALEH